MTDPDETLPDRDPCPDLPGPDDPLTVVCGICGVNPPRPFDTLCAMCAPDSLLPARTRIAHGPPTDGPLVLALADTRDALDLEQQRSAALIQAADSLRNELARVEAERDALAKRYATCRAACAAALPALTTAVEAGCDDDETRAAAMQGHRVLNLLRAALAAKGGGRGEGTEP